MNERPGAWLPRLQEVGERLAEEWISARRPARPDNPQPQELRASDDDRERVAQVLQDAQSTKVDLVEIQWPSGHTDRLSGVAAGQTITIEEGKGQVAARAFQGK